MKGTGKNEGQLIFVFSAFCWPQTNGKLSYILKTGESGENRSWKTDLKYRASDLKIRLEYLGVAVWISNFRFYKLKIRSVTLALDFSFLIQQ